MYVAALLPLGEFCEEFLAVDHIADVLALAYEFVAVEGLDPEREFAAFDRRQLNMRPDGRSDGRRCHMARRHACAEVVLPCCR